jgi:(E)-4-hydroxy-3-methylbut-2-enyl-diphosphate synthase
MTTDKVYPGGEPHHRLDNDKILDHLVELVEKKAAEIRAREEKESVAAE